MGRLGHNERVATFLDVIAPPVFGRHLAILLRRPAPGSVPVEQIQIADFRLLFEKEFFGRNDPPVGLLIIGFAEG